MLVTHCTCTLCTSQLSPQKFLLSHFYFPMLIIAIIIFSLCWPPTVLRLKTVQNSAADLVVDASLNALLKLPLYKLKTKYDHVFSHFGPSVWSSLPQHIRNALTINTFKSALKKNLFNLCCLTNYSPVQFDYPWLHLCTCRLMRTQKLRSPLLRT